MLLRYCWIWKDQALILNGKHVNIFYIFFLSLYKCRWNTETGESNIKSDGLLCICYRSRLSPWMKLMSGDNCQQLPKYFYGDCLQRILHPQLPFLRVAPYRGDASLFQNPENRIEKGMLYFQFIYSLKKDILLWLM